MSGNRSEAAKSCLIRNGSVPFKGQAGCWCSNQSLKPLVNLVNKAGKEDIESLPEIPGNAAFGPLPHPRAVELERLLSLESDVDDLNGDDEQGTEFN